MIPKKMQNKTKKGKCWDFFTLLLLFSKVEHRTTDYQSLGTAKKGKNHVTLSILEAAFCLFLSVESIWFLYLFNVNSHIKLKENSVSSKHLLLWEL
jgi:hypothetical protein